MLFKKTSKFDSPVYGRLGFIAIALILSSMMLAALGFIGLMTTESAVKWVVMIAAGFALLAFLFIVDDHKSALMGLLAFSTLTSVDIGLTNVQKFHYHGNPSLVISLSDVFLIILYFLWVLESHEKRSYKATCKFLPLILFIIFIIWSGISILNSTADIRPWAFYRMVGYLRLLLLFWYLINNIQSFNHIRAILIGAVVAVSLQASQGLIQMGTCHMVSLPLLGGNTEESSRDVIKRSIGTQDSSDQRIRGSTNQPNSLARLLGLYIPIFIFIGIFHKQNPMMRLILSGAAILALIAVGLTLSRSGWISLYIGLAIGFILIARHYRKMGVFVLSAILVQLIILGPLLATDNPISRRIFSADSALDYRGTAYDRISQFQVALNYIKDKPILGVGMGMYAKLLRKYDNSISQFSSRNPVAVHNVYLYFAAENGIPALIFILAFFISILYIGFKSAKHANLLTKLVALGFTMGLISNLIALAYTLYPLETLRSIWIPIGALCAIYLNPHLFVSKQLDDQSISS